MVRLIFSLCCFFSLIFIIDLNAEVIKEYYPNGILRFEQPMKNHVIHGTCHVYFEDGLVMQEVTFEEGLKTGVAKEYYPNGQVRYIYHYVNDKFEGDSIQYYPNGQVHVMVGHKNNQKHGLYQEFYEDGQLMAEYHFEGGVWHGAAMEYFPTGVVSRKMHFAQGQLQGLMTEFYNNKRIHLRLNYIAGQKQGLCRIFNEKGYHLSNRFFINNRPLFEEHIFDKKPVYNVLDITGSAFKHMDQYKSIREIIMTWSEVLVQNPQREDAFFKRSLEYLKLGNIADAVNDLSESLRLDPHFAAAYAVRGCARNILKDMVGANEDFKKAKDLGYAHLEEWESKISLEMLSLFV